MKLLIFSPYYPPHIGGVENYVEDLNKYLSKKGIAITVFTPRLPKDALENEVRHNEVYSVKSGEAGPARRKFNEVKIIRFPAFEIISNYPLPQFWNYKFWTLFIKTFKENPDIVISNTRFFFTSLLALIYSKTKKIPLLHIEHGSSFTQLPGFLKNYFSKLYDYSFGSLILKKSTLNIAISRAVANFISKFDLRPVSIIYRGLNLEKINLVHPNHLLREHYKDRTLICFIGRLIISKGIQDLLQALAGIKNQNFHCFFIGDGSDKKKLKKISENLNLKESVTFFGFQNFEKTIGILKISDIFVNPSYTEGLPTTVLEAAACQKAIIATNVGGTNEIIPDDKYGLLIDPKNPIILKEKIEFLIENPAIREQLGKNVYECVKNNFNWEISVQKFLELFEKFKTNGK